MTARKPRLGLLATAHDYYWPQFPGLQQKSENLLDSVRSLLAQNAEVILPGIVDSASKSQAAGEAFRQAGVDAVMIFPLGYTPGMNMVPAIREVNVPLRILNAHLDRAYDYEAADTAAYLYHEAVCCVPEFAGVLTSLHRDFRVRTGALDDPRLQAELRADIHAFHAAAELKRTNIGLVGQTYTGMGDMPIDEHRLLRATGRLLVRPEVEEVENAFHAVTPAQVRAMTAELRELFEIDASVGTGDLEFSARVAVAYEVVMQRHDIGAFGYYWWGERQLITQLRAQSSLAVSRLASRGCPGVTEGDVKAAIAMKIMHLLGAGGMFVEFFSMDFDEEFVLMGHDGPANLNMAKSRARVTNLDVHHGKSGHGLGIDFEMEPGPVTLLNLSQFESGGTFQLIYTVAEVIPGPVLRIGNPNCRVKLSLPIHDFMDRWCQQGPSHHIVIGYGDRSIAIEAFAESMGFPAVRI